MYNYIKALHIIFIVTWFSGLFYMVRLFIYHTEAAGKPEPARSILQEQFRLMIRRLWMGITWPSAILTLIFGHVIMIGILLIIALILLFFIRKNRKNIFSLIGLFLITATFVFTVNYAFEHFLEQHQKARINVLLGK